MKMIRAMFRPYLRERVLKALHDVKDFPGASISEIMGIRHGDTHHDHKERDPLTTESPHYVELEIIAPDAQVPILVDAIKTSASSGRNGDGKIIISPVEEVIRIWDGESGEDVL